MHITCQPGNRCHRAESPNPAISPSNRPIRRPVMGFKRPKTGTTCDQALTPDLGTSQPACRRRRTRSYCEIKSPGVDRPEHSKGKRRRGQQSDRDAGQHEAHSMSQDEADYLVPPGTRGQSDAQFPRPLGHGQGDDAEKSKADIPRASIQPARAVAPPRTAICSVPRARVLLYPLDSRLSSRP